MDVDGLVPAVLEREGAVPTAALPDRGEESAQLFALLLAAVVVTDELRRLAGALARLDRDGTVDEVRERAGS